MPGPQADIASAWDFADAAGSEGRFAAMLAAAERDGAGEFAAEVRTQIARAQGLQRRFAEAHATLDAAESFVRSSASEVSRLHVRLALERGRIFNSSGDKAAAGPHFLHAWELASLPTSRPDLDGLAVDAAHMVAIVEPPDGAMEWNLRGLALAETSPHLDARRWRASLLNNIGWTVFATGDHAAALGLFERALAARVDQGTEGRLRGPWLVARWCVARTLRAIGRVEEALAEQQRLVEEHAAAGTGDGFVAEEIGECLLALGRGAEATPHFAAAYMALSKDPWLSEREPARIGRLRRLAGGD